MLDNVAIVQCVYRVRQKNSVPPTVIYVPAWPLVVLRRWMAFLNRSSWRDDAIQGMIQATSTDELFVRALIFNYALIQNKNAVNPFERGDPVRNEEDRLV